MDRKTKQADLIFQLGLILKPALDVIADPHRYSAQERAQVRARFLVAKDDLERACVQFCTLPDALYAYERNDIQRALGSMAGHIVGDEFMDNPSALAGPLEEYRVAALKAIASVPAPLDDVIFDAATPFTAYRMISSLCETTKAQLFYCDRYLGDMLIPRLLQGIPVAVKVTIVTWPRASFKGNTRGYDAFLDVSRLYAKERASKYRLLTNPQVHDRWLVCDDQFYHLGGSAKDAADTCVFTVSRLSSTTANLQKWNDLINNGTELFGTSNQNHP